MLFGLFLNILSQIRYYLIYKLFIPPEWFTWSARVLLKTQERIKVLQQRGGKSDCEVCNVYYFSTFSWQSAFRQQFYPQQFIYRTTRSFRENKYAFGCEAFLENYGNAKKIPILNMSSL